MVAIDLTPATVDVLGVRAGDRNLFILNVRTGGRALDLTGYEITAQARTTAETPAHLDAVCTIADAPNGVVNVRWPGDAVRTWLSGSDVLKGVWDLQLDDGSGADPWTVIKGSFTAGMDVTREP